MNQNLNNKQILSPACESCDYSKTLCEESCKKIKCLNTMCTQSNIDAGREVCSDNCYFNGIKCNSKFNC